MLMLVVIVTTIGGHNQETAAEPLCLTERHAFVDAFGAGKPVNSLSDRPWSRFRQHQRTLLQFRPAQFFQGCTEIGDIDMGDVPFHGRYLLPVRASPIHELQLGNRRNQRRNDFFV